MGEVFFFSFFFLIAPPKKLRLHLKPPQRVVMVCICSCSTCGCIVRLNGFRSVPRRDPPPPPTSETSTIWNYYHSWSLRVSTREDNRAMQEGGWGGMGGGVESQLPGEDNVDTVFPRELQRSEELCRARVHGDQDLRKVQEK